MSDKTVKSVLILDEEQGVLDTLVESLIAPDLHIVTCSEVEAAECLMDRFQFDVLVADVRFPKFGGLDGIRLMRHVALRFPRLDVVVFSGEPNQEVRDLGLALGVTEMLEKPTDLCQLQDLVKSLSPAMDETGVVPGGAVTHASRLEEVLENRSISALLQPIVGLDTAGSSSECLGFEGLARGPEGSALRSPEIFLDYASKKELLIDVELLCIEAVLGEARCLPSLGRLFINVRPRSLSTPGFTELLHEMVREHGFQPGDIVLELSKQQSIRDPRAFHTALANLRHHGFGLALDNFGSGLANFDLVGQVPVDYLKIDGFLWRGIEEDPRKQTIVRAILEMARELGIATIVEHVETVRELEVVRSLGASCGQGYYFSRPAPGCDLSHWIGRGPAPAEVLDGQGPVPVPQPGEAGHEQIDHEVSNLITAIALYSAQCMKRVDSEHPLYEDLNQILDASEQVITLSERESSKPSSRVPMRQAGGGTR